MNEMKKFLNPLTSYQRMLYIILLTVLAIGIVFFIVPGIAGGISLGLLIMPVGVFIAFGAFICWMFLKGLHAYDNWWNSLSDAEHAEIEQDFKQAEEVSYYFVAGPRYAFIRNAGCVIPYEKIDDIEFRPGKNARCYMHIHVKDAKMVFVNLPSFSEGEQLYDDLLSYCAPMDDKA